jgi:hypothetical protein
MFLDCAANAWLYFAAEVGNKDLAASKRRGKKCIMQYTHPAQIRFIDRTVNGTIIYYLPIIPVYILLMYQNTANVIQRLDVYLNL